MNMVDWTIIIPLAVLAAASLFLFYRGLSKTLFGMKVVVHDISTGKIVDNVYKYDSNRQLLVNRFTQQTYPLADFLYSVDHNVFVTKLHVYAIVQNNMLLPIRLQIDDDKKQKQIVLQESIYSIATHLYNTLRSITLLRDTPLAEKILSNWEIVVVSGLLFLAAILMILPNLELSLKLADLLIQEYSNKTTVVANETIIDR